MIKILKKIDKNFYQINFPQRESAVFFNLSLKTGYSSENENEFGLGHLLEHYIVNSFNKLETHSNFYVNGNIDFDRTNYYLKTTKKRLLEDIKLFLDKLFSPNFDDIELFELEKKVIKNEIGSKLNFKNQKKYSFLFKQLVTKECRYSRDEGQKISGLKNKKLSDIKKYHKKFFNDKNINFFVSGYKINSEDVEKINLYIKKYRLPKKKDFSDKVKICKYLGSKILESRKFAPKNGVDIDISFPFVCQTDKKNANEKILASFIKKIFVYHDSDFVRELRSFGVYSPDFFWVSQKGFGGLGFSANVPKETVEDVLVYFKDFVSNLKKEGIKENKLKKIKNEMKNEVKRATKENKSILDWVIYDVSVYGEFISLEEDIDFIENINSEKIKKFTKKYFDFKKIFVFVLNNERKIGNKKIRAIFDI